MAGCSRKASPIGDLNRPLCRSDPFRDQGVTSPPDGSRIRRRGCGLPSRVSGARSRVTLPRVSTPIVADIRGTAVSNHLLERVSHTGIRIQRGLVDKITVIDDVVATRLFGEDHGLDIVLLGADFERFRSEGNTGGWTRLGGHDTHWIRRPPPLVARTGPADRIVLVRQQTLC